MFATHLNRAAIAVAAHLETVFHTLDDLPISRAMAHATKGGKCLRGFFVLETARLHDVSFEQAIFPATAIEVMHAYSLVHDDLPCMDDDDLRRGEPTVHIKWDEATAVLAGDALQALAFELVANPAVGSGDVRAEMAITLAKAAGARGMVLGQAIDIYAETAPVPLSLEQITKLQQGKTGALITWSALAGARLAGADTGPLAKYASAVGLAFQIADDILDVTGDTATVGKATGKDANAGKATFVSHLGLDGAKRRAHELVQSACDDLSVYGDEAETLRQAAAFVIARKS